MYSKGSYRKKRHSRKRHSSQRPSSQKGGWSLFRRKQNPIKTTLRNPFAGFFRRMFTYKSKAKVNPFEGVPVNVDPTTGHTRVIEKKSMEKFNSNKNHPVVMHLVAHPTQISPRPRSMTKSRPQSLTKSMNHSRRSVAI